MIEYRIQQRNALQLGTDRRLQSKRNDYAAPLHSCKCRRLHAPATKVTCRKRSSDSDGLFLCTVAPSTAARLPLSSMPEFLSVRGWSQHDGVHQAAQGLGRLDTTFGRLERLGELRNLRAVQPGHLRMQKRRRSSAAATFAWTASRRSAFAFSSSLTSLAGTPSMMDSTSFLRRASIRSISRSSAVKSARCSMRSRFISRVNSSQNSSNNS